jgi:hypothetical protein
MRETRSYGSVRGATREGCPYRDQILGEEFRWLVRRDKS